MLPLVSILTPTYNCGKYIHRLLNSVLMQTYPRIEMFVIDDGSTDGTKQIIADYIPRFTQKGYKLFYHYQTNQGQSNAINNGLKMLNGDYLVWPDADDFYKATNAVECLVDVFENNKDIGMARCLIEYVTEDNLIVTHAINEKQQFSDNLFEDCLYQKNGFWYCAGGYMLKINDLRMRIPQMDIYTSKLAGQNWQLMLPMLYHKKCVTIPQVMYTVLERQSSHSRGQFTTRKQIVGKYHSYRDTILSTINRIQEMPENERKRIKCNIRRKYFILTAKYNLYCWFKKPLNKFLSN